MSEYEEIDGKIYEKTELSDTDLLSRKQAYQTEIDALNGENAALSARQSEISDRITELNSKIDEIDSLLE